MERERERVGGMTVQLLSPHLHFSSWDGRDHTAAILLTQLSKRFELLPSSLIVQLCARTSDGVLAIGQCLSSH